MWAIEDAEEEARKLAERQHPHNSHDSNINQNSSDNSREMGYGGTTCESAAAGAIRMGVGYEDDAHEERTDSEEEFLRERREKRREKRAKHASAQAKVAAVASATPPTAIAIPNSVVSVDDPALDAECLSFLNKMSMKIPTK